ncbi:hypothetical protein D3C87_2148240 [compost metagenome]
MRVARRGEGLFEEDAQHPVTEGEVDPVGVEAGHPPVALPGTGEVDRIAADGVGVILVHVVEGGLLRLREVGDRTGR